MAVYCVQSSRAISSARRIAVQPGVLHAANQGSKAGDDIACNPRKEASASRETVLVGPRHSPVTGRPDIACNTLPYVFARLGLPPHSCSALVSAMLVSNDHRGTAGGAA